MTIKKIISLLLVVLLTSILLNTQIQAEWLYAAESVENPSLNYQDESMNTMYGIGSISKVFTAAAVMLLVDEDRIDLEAAVTAYIPEFTMADERYKDITVRMLLNHSSGIMGSSFHNDILIGDNDTYAHDNLLISLKQQRLKANPGAFSVYCNNGFTLAEIIVERVSGISFTQFIEENFFKPIQMSNTTTPLSNFDSDRLAKNYHLGFIELPKENINTIGAGGIYSTAVDLCKFAQVFMKDSNEILSDKSLKAMENKESLNQMASVEGDTTFNYGLGWDGVDTYPFNRYNIKALSKGGGTVFYHSNLTVLPEHNLAAAVISSGGPALEQLIAQEILLEVLKEEGLIDEIKDDKTYLVSEPGIIPDQIKEFAGIYDSFSMLKVEFSDTNLYLSNIGTKNDKTQEYIYMKDGSFVSANGDYIGVAGLLAANGGTTGTTKISFKKESNGERYLFVSTYENASGLGQGAYTAPFAQKVHENKVSDAVTSIWEARTKKTYYLVNEKYTSTAYLSSPIGRIALNNEIPGYVISGTYKGPGLEIRDTKIVDEYKAISFQQIPVMTGRDLNDLYLYNENGFEYLHVGENSYVSEDALDNISAIKEQITIDEDGLSKWFKVDGLSEGKKITIIPPSNGAVYIYDDKYTCIATSISLSSKNTFILPVGGTVVFAAEPGGQFSVSEN